MNPPSFLVRTYTVFQSLIDFKILGISWDELESHRGYPVDLQPQVEIQSLLDDVQPSLSSVFEQF